MAMFDDYMPVQASANVAAAPPLFPDYAPVPVAGQPREAKGALEAFQAGIQGSAPGLAWRGKLPDLVTNPENAAWWERALTGIAQVGAELPLMIGGAIAGAPAGAAIGTAIAPGAGTAVGTLLGAGAGMGAVPAALRETLIQAYKSGEIKTVAEFWNALREVAKTTATEAGLNAAGMGAGALAARALGTAIAPAVGRSISVPTATASIEGADLVTQVAAMATLPAAMQGRLPDAQEIMDAAILIGGLKAAHVAAGRITNTFIKTGKLPAEQVEEARRDPAVAEDMVAPEQVGDYTPREILRIQESLFRETDRLAELEARAAAGAETTAVGPDGQPIVVPGAAGQALTAAEIQSIQVLRNRVTELEAQLKAAVDSTTDTPAAEIPLRYTPDQLTEAKAMAEARIAELQAKADVQPLLDAERAERVFLSNNLQNAEAMAKHFGFERRPAEGMTRETWDQSAKQVYDDALEQIRAAYAAREAAGLTAFGDEHAQLVATLIMREARTYASMQEALPWDIYQERYLRIRDAAQEAEAAAEAAIPPDAPRFVPPETDLFGDPIQVTSAPRRAVETLATVEIPLTGLVLSKDVPQFKNAANTEGVVVPLGGTFDRTGVGPIQVWERLNGTLEVISGRHRLDLARRSGEETIPAQIHREADGFTRDMAAMLDAELNIREEQGSVADYAQYFEAAGLSREAADARGLLARAKGRAGYAIARDGSPDLIAAHRAGVLSDEAALSISAAAPGSARLQALGIQEVNEGKSILYAVNMMKSVDMMAAERMLAGEQGDIFGFDDSAMKTAAAMAKKASSKQRQISEQISAVSGASRRPEIARRLGVDVQDPEAVQKKILELKQEQYLWDNWPLYPELVAKLRAETLKQGPARAASAKDWQDAPLLEEDYVTWDAINRLEHEPYVKDGTVVANSRQVPNDQQFPPVGTWRISHLKGIHGREIEQLVEVPIASLRLSELDSRGRLDPTKAGDDVRYAEWLKEGKRPPPINVLQQDSGSLTVTDGHRRALAAKLAGRETVEAWVNYAVPIPDGGRINSDPSKPFIRTGMTYEMLTGEIKNPYLDRMALSESFDLKPETPAELEARNREAAAQAQRKLAQERAGIKGKNVTADQLDIFNTQGTLFQSTRNTWYRSALTDSIDTANIKSAPAKGWMDHLKGQIAKGAVKRDEIDAVGLEEWLQLQEGKVSKEQVQDYLKANGVKVEEVALGAEGQPNIGDPRIAADVETIRKAGWTIEQSPDEPNYVGFMDPNGDLIDAADLRNFARNSEPELAPIAEAATRIAQHMNEGGADGKPTKFSQYQLPGGQNYRELLLTLPTPMQRLGFADGQRVTLDQISQRVHGKKFMELTREQADEMQTLQQSENAAFRSSHFNEPNILAHVRFNERTDAEGKKVLFIEEIQSDWAQKGKKEGFADPKANAELDAINKRMQALSQERDPITNRMIDEKAWHDLARQKDSIVRRTLGVPSAPFVGKTDAWVALSLKRMIAYAAENGFDRIAWTTGKQQVERYTSALRNQVDAIEWNKTKDGIQLVGYKGTQKEVRPADIADRAIVAELGQRRFQLNHREQTALAQAEARLATRGYRTKVVDTTEKETALSDAIGKAMADKIINDPNQSGTIEGDNITIDSTGMAGFYDRIVPKVANEVLKKFGGGKVHDTGIAFATNPHEGSATYVVRDRSGNTDSVLTLGRAQQRAQEIGGTLELREGNPEPQQSFDITPAMREKVQSGLPLFQRQQDANRGSYQVAERIITMFEQADRSTLVHELSHHFLENLKYFASKPNAPARVKAMWDTARQEFAIGEDGVISVASHEQNARSFERYLGEGEAPSTALRDLFAKFKEWMLEIYNDLRNIGAEINPNIRSLFDRMLATDEEIAAARDLGVPRAYVPEAKAALADEIVPPPGAPRRKVEPNAIDEAIARTPFAEEVRPGPGSGPTMDSRVNPQYINGPTELKLALERLTEINQAEIQRQRGGVDGVKTWEQTNAEIEQRMQATLGGGPDTLNLLGARDPDAATTDARLRAKYQIMVAAAQYSLKQRDIILEKGDNTTVQEQFNYLSSIARVRMIHAEYLGDRAAVARALNQIKDMTEGSGTVAKMIEMIPGGGDTLFQAAKDAAQEAAELKLKLEELMARHFNGKSALDIAKLHKDLKTIKQSVEFSKGVTEATKWDMVVEGWKSSLLSGPVTHTTNLFGTGAFQVLRAPVDALASIIGIARGASPGMGETDRASMSEAIGRITGMLGGVQDGAKLAYHTFLQDEATMKTESYREAIPGRAGQIIRIPLRLMGAEDAWIGSMYERGELRTLAIRTAFDEQMNPATREFAARVDYLMDHPTETMQAIAKDARDRMTFNAPLGEKGVALQLFVAKWNLQWVIPFIRTPINIAKELARMSPFAPVVGEWRADIAKGGVARDRALAEIALGSGIMALTMAYAFSGNVSGGPSPDPGKNRGKAGVWQPYSILIGDTWYEYARLQPTGTLMGMAADVAAVWDHMTEEEKDKIPKMLAGAFAQAVTNQTFLQGITNVVNAMSDPTRFAPRFFEQLAGSVVPNIIGQPTAIADPVVREVNGMLEAIQARIPGMRQDLLPKRDWLGEPVPAKERIGVVLPSRMQPVSEDKVRLEAARLDISMAATPKKTHIGKGTGKLGDVKLTPEEQDKFAEVGGKFAHDILTNIVNAPGYDEMPDLVKRRIFGRVLTASHRLAAVQAMPLDKRIQYIQSISERVAQELAPGEEQQ